MQQFLNVLGLLIVLVAAGFVLRVIIQAGIDGHHRGLARVQRGQSWTPKVTSSHDEQAAA